VTGNSDEIVIGRITGAHGIKGWVKVFSYTDPMEQILEYVPWQLVKGGSRQEIHLEEGRLQGKRLVDQDQQVGTSGTRAG
jgi:16S rRNA processing protein RimM